MSRLPQLSESALSQLPTLHHTEDTEPQLSLATISQTSRPHHGRSTQPRAPKTAQSTQPHSQAVPAPTLASTNTTAALVIGLSPLALQAHTAPTRCDEVNQSMSSELSDGGHGPTLPQSTLLLRRPTPLPWASVLLNAMLVSLPTKMSLLPVLAPLQVSLLQATSMATTDTTATTKSSIGNT